MELTAAALFMLTVASVFDSRKVYAAEGRRGLSRLGSGKKRVSERATGNCSKKSDQRYPKYVSGSFDHKLGETEFETLNESDTCDVFKQLHVLIPRTEDNHPEKIRRAACIVMSHMDIWDQFCPCNVAYCHKHKKESRADLCRFKLNFATGVGNDCVHGCEQFIHQCCCKDFADDRDIIEIDLPEINRDDPL